MKEAHKFFDDYRNRMTSSLHTCAFARIVNVDMKYMRADVLPLFDKELPILLKVPIATHQTEKMFIRPPYRAGDLVLLVFSMRDIEPVLYEEYASDSSTRMVSLDDALIIGGVTPFTKPLPGDFDKHNEDWVMATRDYKTRVIMTKEGSVIIDVVDGQKIYLADKPKDGIEQGVPLGNALKEWLDNHTHGGDGKPTTKSPEPSKKVKVQ